MSKLYQVSENQVNSVDVLVGKRIRHGRWIAGISQSELAEKLCVSLSQLQEYEHGKARIPASSLFKAAEVFGVPVSYFFSVPRKNGIEPSVEPQKPSVNDVEETTLYECLVGNSDRLQLTDQQKIIALLQSRAEIELCCADTKYAPYG